jgi:hypothetical protein
MQHGWQKQEIPKIVVQRQRWYREIILKGGDNVEIDV